MFETSHEEGRVTFQCYWRQQTYRDPTNLSKPVIKCQKREDVKTLSKNQ